MGVNFLEGARQNPNSYYYLFGSFVKIASFKILHLGLFVNSNKEEVRFPIKSETSADLAVRSCLQKTTGFFFWFGRGAVLISTNLNILKILRSVVSESDPLLMN